jgi:hypothetical protein
MTNFSVDLGKAIKGLKGTKDKIIKGTLVDLSRLIIKGTPVGDPSLWAPQSLPAPVGYVGGALRGAWNGSFNAPDLSSSSRRVASNGDSTINRVRTVVNGYQAGQTFYLTNPLPYAYRVEYGWSKQAPQGMVRLNIMKLQNILDSQ